MHGAEFGETWIAAWNAHDLEAILALYTDDIVFLSPASTRITGDPSGRVVGKQALRDYWRQALALSPDLRFTLKSVFEGVDGVALRYHSTRTGREVVEVHRLDAEGLVCEAAAYYE